MITLILPAKGSLEFIERAVEQGVIVSIGHSEASPECIKSAIAAGAKFSTHLGNGFQRKFTDTKPDMDPLSR